MNEEQNIFTLTCHIQRRCSGFCTVLIAVISTFWALITGRQGGTQAGRQAGREMSGGRQGSVGSERARKGDEGRDKVLGVGWSGSGQVR